MHQNFQCFTVLGKSAKPRCFKNVISLPTQYDANTKVSMTRAIFTKWVTKFDIKCQRQRHKVILIIDNCPGHPKIQGLNAVTLIFLPPNTTRHQISEAPLQKKNKSSGNIYAPLTTMKRLEQRPGCALLPTTSLEQRHTTDNYQLLPTRRV